MQGHTCIVPNYRSKLGIRHCSGLLFAELETSLTIWPIMRYYVFFMCTEDWGYTPQTRKHSFSAATCTSTRGKGKERTKERKKGRRKE